MQAVIMDVREIVDFVDACLDDAAAKAAPEVAAHLEKVLKSLSNASKQRAKAIRERLSGRIEAASISEDQSEKSFKACRSILAPELIGEGGVVDSEFVMLERFPEEVTHEGKRYIFTHMVGWNTATDKPSAEYTGEDGERVWVDTRGNVTPD
jgi:hypothetical protein